MKAEQLEALGRLKPAKVFTGLAILATVGFGVALTIWQASEAPAAPQVRRHHRANASPTPEPVAEGVAPAEAEQDSSWVQSWMSSWNSFLGNAMGGGQPEPIGVSVGDWKPGDPWPGGVECASGKLTDAFHMKPDKGCEPSCTQCQMVCLPSAFVGPFKNHGGELGSNCFERGCSQYKGSGSRSGVTFYMYDCDPALQQQWAEANAQLTHEQVEQRLEECLAECSRRDKQCQLACEATHKEVCACPLASLARPTQRPPTRVRFLVAWRSICLKLTSPDTFGALPSRACRRTLPPPPCAIMCVYAGAG